MSNCPKCGSPISANDRFCNKCGTPINSAPALSCISDEKSKALLSIGALSGLGASLLLVGLFIAFALNGIYQQQIRYLASNNISIYALGLDDMVFLISTGALLAIFGVYTLVFGLLGLFSSKARIAIALKEGYARVGNGFLNAGIIVTGLSSANLVRDLYRPTSSSWYESVLFAFIIGGLIGLTIGAFLIRYAYQRSLQPTKA